MRLKYSKLCTLLTILINIILLFYTWKLFVGPNNATETMPTESAGIVEKNKQKDRIQSANKHIKKAITIIFRDFYHFENDLQHSIDSILNLIPNVQILVVYDVEPYPPMAFIRNYTTTRSNVKFINLSFDVRRTAKALQPVFHIKTKYVLFVPDSIRLGGRTIIQKMLKEIEKSTSNELSKLAAEKNGKTDNDGGTIGEKQKSSSKAATRTIIVIPFASNVKTMGNCCRIKLDFANWTMEYGVKNGTTNCDMVSKMNYYYVFINDFNLQ